MPQHESYLLHIWRSRALSGRQWAARLHRLSNGERVRFADPEALLTYLQGLVQGEPGEDRAEDRGSGSESRGD